MGLVKLECLLQVKVEGAVETVYAAIALSHLAIVVLQILLELLLHLWVSHQGFEALADACIVTIDTQDASLIPTPNFPSYRQDPATAPGADLLKNPNVEKLVTINCNKEGSKVPTIYKANLSYTHYFSDRFKMGVAGYMTLARHN